MIRKCLGFVLACLSAASCSSEKNTLSPLYDSLGSLSDQPAPGNPRIASNEIFYASELTNQISTIPHFSNDAVNREVGVLKNNIKEYVLAVRAKNPVGRKNAIGKVEKSYKKIQELRGFLNKDDNDTINRYLVRIKSNISRLEAIKDQNTSL